MNFSIVHEDEASSHCKYDGRFVDHLKFEGTEKEFPKRYFVVQPFLNKLRGPLTQSPTVRRLLQPLVLSFRATACRQTPTLQMILRDVDRSYAQALFNRPIWARPSSELALPDKFSYFLTTLFTGSQNPVFFVSTFTTVTTLNTSVWIHPPATCVLRT